MRLAEGMVAAVSCNDVYSFTKPVREEIVLVAGLGVEGDVHAGVHVKHRGRVRADPTQPNMRQVHLLQGELFEEVAAKGYAVAPGELGENVTTRGLDLLALPVGTILRFGAGPSGGPLADGPAGVEAVAGEGRAVAGGVPAVAGVGRAVAGEGRTVAGSIEAGAEVGGVGAVRGVLAAAAAAALDAPTARAAIAVEAAAGRDRGGDPRPAVILAGLRNPCGQINGFRAGLLKEVIAQDDDGNVVRKAGVMAVVLRGGSVRPGDQVTVELPPHSHAPLERV
jgi:MOSC domain-containing protein YiiM